MPACMQEAELFRIRFGQLLVTDLDKVSEQAGS
jgi:hypothetical protein